MPQNNNPAELAASRIAVSAILFAVFLLHSGCAESRDPAEMGFPDSWSIGGSSDSSMSLAYGPPESDNFLVLFICDEKSRAISTHFSWLVLDLSEGATLPVFLSSGGKKIVLQGRARHHEDSPDTVSIEAEGPSRDDLAWLLGDDAELAMRLSSYEVDIPLEGAVVAAEPFLDFCAPR